MTDNVGGAIVFVAFAGSEIGTFRQQIRVKRFLGTANFAVKSSLAFSQKTRRRVNLYSCPIRTTRYQQILLNENRHGS